ncbi:SDR family NAD(P)-dependent oxidoreductase [Paraburkholderia sp. 32]|uniref:SDR family NAD(P)-dependent oxidoreductase n=1 Tax=Paraburkholderia sp. 32 TaxID=2991057 RepID=UPI003D1BD5A8
MRPRFDGRVALVTSAGTATGAATAAPMRSEGAHVYMLGRREAPLEVMATVTGAIAVVADAADAVQVRSALGRILQRHNRLDAAIAQSRRPRRRRARRPGDDCGAARAASISPSRSSSCVKRRRC